MVPRIHCMLLGPSRLIFGSMKWPYPKKVFQYLDHFRRKITCYGLFYTHFSHGKCSIFGNFHKSLPISTSLKPMFSGKCVGAGVILLALSCGITVLTRRLHCSGQDGGPVPGWLRRVTLVYLARGVCMKKTAVGTPNKQANCELNKHFHEGRDGGSRIIPHT